MWTSPAAAVHNTTVHPPERLPRRIMFCASVTLDETFLSGKIRFALRRGVDELTLYRHYDVDHLARVF